MSEDLLWQAYVNARLAYQDDRSAGAESRMVEAFAAFAIEFIGDPLAAHEEIERLRRSLTQSRAAA